MPSMSSLPAPVNGEHMTFDRDSRKALLEVRDLLKDINQKLSHLIEQDMTDRRVLDNVRIYDDDG